MHKSSSGEIFGILKTKRQSKLPQNVCCPSKQTTVDPCLQSQQSSASSCLHLPFRLLSKENEDDVTKVEEEEVGAGDAIRAHLYFAAATCVELEFCFAPHAKGSNNASFICMRHFSYATTAVFPIDSLLEKKNVDPSVRRVVPEF